MYCAKILGIGACSILYVFLTEVLKYKNVSYNINERADGNGINDKNVEQIASLHFISLAMTLLFYDKTNSFSRKFRLQL